MMNILSLRFRTLVPAFFLLFACVAIPKAAYAEGSGDKPIRTIPAQRPAWVDELPEFDDKQCFVGISETASIEQDARMYAQQNAQGSLAAFIETNTRTEMQNAFGRHGKTREDADTEFTELQRTGSLTKGVFTNLKDRGYYTEIYADGKDRKRQKYKVYVRMEIPNAVLQEVVANAIDERRAALERAAAQETDPVKKSVIETTQEILQDVNAGEVVNKPELEP